MLLNVSVIRQSCGPGHVVKYTADVEILPSESGVTVEVLSVEPPDADPFPIAEAAESIRLGAESVLVPRGFGGALRLERLFIHDVDFLLQKFTSITADEFSHALDASV